MKYISSRGVFFIGWLIVVVFLIQLNIGEGTKLIMGGLLFIQLMIYGDILVRTDKEETDKAIRAESEKAFESLKKK